MSEMPESKFGLLGGEFLLYKDKPEFTIFEKKFVEPVLKKVQELEKTKGDEFAFKALQLVEREGPISVAMRRVNDSDVYKVQAVRAGQRKLELGSKYRCEKCSKVFHDLGRAETVCPGCNVSVSECTKL